VASFYTDKLAYIHVPKTGGTWLMQALEAVGIMYKVVAEGAASHVHWNAMPSRPFRFGFVRYPPTWYLSYWSYVRTTDQPVSDNSLDRAVLDHPEFPAFVEFACEYLPGFLSQMYDVYLGPPGAIEFVGRYENLTDDLIHALRLAGEVDGWDDTDFDPIRNLEPKNVSAKTSGTVITPALEAMIVDAEKSAIDRFYGARVLS
jgi:hypothetical protein